VKQLNQLPVVLKSMIIVSLVVLFFGLGLSKIWHICLFELLFRLHCPACFSTRSIELLISGNVLDSITLNPLPTILLVYFLFDIYAQQKGNQNLRNLLNRGLLYFSILNFFYLNSNLSLWL
jgi:hypothetical protein